jgi:FAD/FMN-containing dehydrogenase
MLEQQRTTASWEETAVQELVSRMRGELFRPADAGYEQARAVYNALIDRHPALIARDKDFADVIAAVTFAREHELTLAVRGGGHSGPGLGTCDDGLVIDLSDQVANKEPFLSLGNCIDRTEGSRVCITV